jgi:hypothetical protein
MLLHDTALYTSIDENHYFRVNLMRLKGRYDNYYATSWKRIDLYKSKVISKPLVMNVDLV